MIENAVVREIDTDSLQYIGEGVFGKCYLTSDGKVIKIFNRNPIGFETDIQRLATLSSDSYVFPKELLYYPIIERGKLIGYTMDYIDGNPIYNLQGNVDMSELLSAVCILEKDTDMISSESVQIKDMKGSNTLYSNGRIFVIDTDLYTFIDDAGYNEMKMGNLQEIAYLISTAVIKRNERKFKSTRLLNLYNDSYYGKVNPSCFLYEIMEEIRRVKGEDVKTYDDFYKGMKLIMRK